LVLERGDPLRCVLVGARGLDDTLVILAGHAGKRGELALRGGLLGLLLGLGLSTLAVARIDRVDAAMEEVMRIARQVAGCCEAVTGLRVTAEACDTKAHLRAIALLLRASQCGVGEKCRQINDLGNFRCVLTAWCCALVA
jgi:hypothetical protein